MPETERSSLSVWRSDALLVVDVQNDFVPGGALAVTAGDAIVPGVNAMMARFSCAGAMVVLTQDWHPPRHRSFASAHPGAKPFDPHEEPGIGPVLWPDHCVAGTRGAELHPALDTRLAHAIVRKGWRPDVDSYSAFLENDRRTPTGLDGLLRSAGVRRVFVCGLALDFCVAYSARDAREHGFEVVVIEDLCRGIDVPAGSVERALRGMRQSWVVVERAERIA